MFNLISARYRQGKQAIPKIKKAVVGGQFRGFPLLDESACEGSAACADCQLCEQLCPTGALAVSPLRIDLGRCIFCGICQEQCPAGAIKFSTYHKTAATTRSALVIPAGANPIAWQAEAIQASKRLRRLFSRSLVLRSVSAGGCNACELELNACSNPNFDMGRFGITISASPRHADGLILTGPITRNMAPALADAWESIPAPKLLILAGTCAISGGIFANSRGLDRIFLANHPVDLYVPGCPLHPLTLINGILGVLGK